MPSSPARRIDLDEPISPRVVRSMRARIDELEEALRQAHEANENASPLPASWQLTATESRFLQVLGMAKGYVRSKERLLVALYGLEADVDIKIIDVFACKLRRKLAGTGIEIQTVWGEGYRLTDASLDAYRRALSEAAPVQAADRAEIEAELKTRIAALEAENAGLRAEIAEAGAAAPAAEPRPRLSWRDHAGSGKCRGGGGGSP